MHEPTLAEGTLYGDVMRACLRRKVALFPEKGGGIGMRGAREDVDALGDFVQQFAAEIHQLLTAFHKARRPKRFAELH